jgi:RNA polymerase sigma factor for flagellar operon FliA
MATAARQRATKRQHAVVAENLGLVKQVARQFHVGPGSPVDMSDLIQYGILGLIDASEKFDASKGTSFQSYARFRIRGSILDGLRHLDFLPRSVRRKRRELLAATQRVEQAVGGAASEEAIADEMDLEPEELHALMERIRGASLSSVEEMEERGAEAELSEAMQGHAPADGPAQDLERAEVRALVMAALDELPEKERTVLALYYYEELTMREVGDVLGVTESRVSQLHAKALTRLRSRLSLPVVAV